WQRDRELELPPDRPSDDGLESVVVRTEILDEIGDERLLLVVRDVSPPANHLGEVCCPLLFGEVLLPNHICGMTFEARLVRERFGRASRELRQAGPENGEALVEIGGSCRRLFSLAGFSGRGFGRTEQSGPEESKHREHRETRAPAHAVTSISTVGQPLKR